MLETGHADFVMRRIRDNLVVQHIAYVYEDICLQKMWQLGAANELPFMADKIGRWWDNKNEIDIVAYDSNGSSIMFGECKYTNQPMDTNIFYDLLQKKTSVEWKKETRREFYIFFSVNGFTKEMQDLAGKRTDIMLFE